LLESGRKEITEQFFDRLKLLRKKLGPIILDLTTYEAEGISKRLSSVFDLFPDDCRYVIMIDDSGRQILWKKLEGNKAKRRIVFCEKLSGVSPKPSESIGSFNYWHLFLDGEIDKKFASRLATRLGRIISHLVPEGREVFLVLESSKYGKIMLVREHLLKTLGDLS